jgi:hypothetical protein
VAGEIDPVRVVDDAIENGVSVGRIADQPVPFVDRDLAGDDCRSPTVAFFEDFEEVVAGGSIERLAVSRPWYLFHIDARQLVMRIERIEICMCVL